MTPEEQLKSEVDSALARVEELKRICTRYSSPDTVNIWHEPARESTILLKELQSIRLLLNNLELFNDDRRRERQPPGSEVYYVRYVFLTDDDDGHFEWCSRGPCKIEELRYFEGGFCYKLDDEFGPISPDQVFDSEQEAMDDADRRHNEELESKKRKRKVPPSLPSAEELASINRARVVRCLPPVDQDG